MVHPGIHFKAVEGDTLPANSEFGQGRAHFPVEAVAVHAQVGRGVAKSDQAGLDLHGYLPRYTAVICSLTWPSSWLMASRAR